MTGLVLEGGGARGSYHVGAIKAFRKKGIKFNAVVGTSIGSINAAFVASKNYRKLYKLWNKATSKEIFDIDENIVDAFHNRSITSKIVKDGIKTTARIIKNRGIDTNRLKKLIANNLDEDKLRKSNIDFGLATFNISERKPIEIFKNDIPKGKIVDFIIASCYLPIFKFERIIDDKFYFDGGIFNNCPVNMLDNKGYDTIYIVRSFKNKLKCKCSHDIKIIEISARKKLGSIILFSKNLIKYNIKLGYFDTIKTLDKLDGKNYYYKNKDASYYEKLINKKDYTRVKRKYMKYSFLKEKKSIILNILEKACIEYNINKFKVYSIFRLVLILKIKNFNKKDYFYYDFIKALKII